MNISVLVIGSEAALVTTLRSSSSWPAEVHVLTARDGASGLERAASEEPSVIVIGSIPPDEDECELCRRLVADCRGSSVPIVQMIDSDVGPRGAEALAAGVTAFLRRSAGELETVALLRSMARLEASQRAEATANLRLRVLFECSPDGMVLSDPDFRYLDVNNRYCTMLGYTREELIGTHASKIVVPAEVPRIGPYLYDDLSKSTSYRQVWKFRRKDGSTFDGEVDATVMPDGSAFGVIADLTEQRRTEEQKRRLQEQLRVSQRMEVVGQLVGGIAHDFNNLLAVIIGNVELVLGDEDLGTPRRADLEAVLEATNSAVALIDQLMSFSGKRRLLPVPVDLNDTVRVMDNMLTRMLGERLELSYRLAPDLWRVRIDPSQAEQIVVNLIVNARDAMPNGGTVTIATTNVELGESDASTWDLPAGPYVQLSVADTGVGMDEQTRARIFEPFFTTKAPSRGTGLGLATVHGITTQCGGAITLDSEQGKGTTFTLYLPRELAAPPPVSATDPDVPTDTTGDETIVVVEDERALRTVLARFLRNAGYTVVTARDGQEALQKSLEHPGPIHLLLADVVMPRMGGPQLARKLRENHPDCLSILMSGYSGDELESYEERVPGGLVLQKPFTREELLVCVRKTLTSH